MTSFLEELRSENKDCSLLKIVFHVTNYTNERSFYLDYITHIFNET